MAPQPIPLETASPALLAAREAQRKAHACIDQGKHFLLEAGAGAGKTYSLISALQYIIEKRGKEMIRNRQQIACITYTNVACDEIRSRTDKHPAVFASTIHAFCWELIKGFQPYLREKVPTLPKFAEKLVATGGTVGDRQIDYDLGHRSVSEKRISIWHDDVIALTVDLMEQEKFRRILGARFPVLFIDEYQDMNVSFAQSIKKHFLGSSGLPLVGLFGDHWQKIYNNVCGKIEHPSLEVIEKGANFRSAPEIIEVLNKMRPALPQAVGKNSTKGSVAVYHTNGSSEPRRTDSQWKGDLPADAAHQYLCGLRRHLESEGWAFRAPETKILMLTNSILGREQGYGSFYDVFECPESYLEKQDPYIAFLVDIIEPVSVAYQSKRYGEMFAALDSRTPTIQKHSDKDEWKKDMDRLLELRMSGTIGMVIEHLRRCGRPKLPERLERKELALEQYLTNPPIEPDRSMEERRKLAGVRYTELIALDNYIDKKTPFSTKHGVKGAQFENVLVVIGRGWNMYDFNQMLEWFRSGVPTGKDPTFERNRNLFYVACSRPKQRLAILFTQKLSGDALSTLRDWFGADSVKDLAQQDARIR
jgi:DNA helicase-2/ATP-dependent DNA helicase PcrA